MANFSSSGDGRPARVVEATKARSGLRGVHVLWILIVSMALVAVGYVILLAAQGPGLGGPGGQTQTQRPTVSAPQSPVKQTPAG